MKKVWEENYQNTNSDSPPPPGFQLMFFFCVIFCVFCILIHKEMSFLHLENQKQQKLPWPGKQGPPPPSPPAVDAHLQEKGTQTAALFSVTEGPGPQGLNTWGLVFLSQAPRLGHPLRDVQAGSMTKRHSSRFLKAEDTSRAATMIPAPAPPTSGTP